jgi:hypothetical protein
MVTNSSIGLLQTNLENNLTRQISALDDKFISKTSDLDSKLRDLDSKFRILGLETSALDAKFVSKTRDLDSEMNTKFGRLEERVESQLLWLIVTAPILCGAVLWHF